MPDIRYSATTDQTTMCNFAHHRNFNLDGFDSIADHLLNKNMFPGYGVSD